VTEQLGFEQAFRNRAAVERDEPILAPRAGEVDRAGNHFLPGAGLAANQDGRRCSRDGVDQLEERAHARAAPDHRARSVAVIELLPQVGVLVPETALFEGDVEHVRQLLELERLGDEVRRAALDHLDGILHRSITGDRNRDDSRIQLKCLVDNSVAVDAWQPQVRHDGVEGKVTEELDGLLAGLGLGDLIPHFSKPFGRDFAKWSLVVDE
jgi:hypothetical protein